MFLFLLPDPVRWLLLFAAGALAGSVANLLIYELSWFRRRNISPWSAAEGDQLARTWLDRIPVFGWFRLRRESKQHGRGFWIRPLLIEVAMGLFVAWFFHWQHEGGLFGSRLNEIGAAQREPLNGWMTGWFVFHSLLVFLLVVATFVDFDDQTIPDGITLTGTLVALVAVVMFPALRLPVVENGIGFLRIAALSWWTPDKPADWPNEWTGMVFGLVIVLGWCAALVPKVATLRCGFIKGIRLMCASVFRPDRRVESRLGTRKRGMLPFTRFLGLVAAGLVALVAVIWNAGGESWNALFDSLMGLAAGGGIVWLVRLVAGHAMGVEAMGFGDVTLMAMVGAFMGWQASLLIFVLAPFVSLGVALIQVVLTGNNRLAFGPYLCIASVIVLIGWNSVWNEWASTGLFALGGTFLIAILGTCLVLFGLMLFAWGAIRSRFRNDAS
jgi:leader peptidase (prepilin peptidase) / N-methyltransferase